MKYKNPVIRGFYPDPSFCKANGKYYLVNSTFQYFPGIPLFESTDMVNWKPIGAVLNRESQLPLSGTGTRGGIYAPTIRYHEGRFYMVVTNVSYSGNFYVYTDDIYGEWSDPIYVDQGGIDPTIFFDDDGKVYFISNDGKLNGVPCIQICEIDIETGEKLTESEPLWCGTGGRYVEAPHLYKHNGYYYLLDAEGGTEYGHMVNYARSKNIRGPWEPFPGNPALTMRDTPFSQLQGSGHGDLLEDDNGDWWFCHLAFREIPGASHHHHLGRETCLIPAEWRDDWFYIGDGTVHEYYDLPDRPDVAMQERSFCYSFENLSPEADYCFIHRYEQAHYAFGEHSLVLTGKDASPFCVNDDPVFAGIRVSEMKEDLEVTLRAACAEAGASFYMDPDHHYDLFIENGTRAVLRFTVGCVTQRVKEVEVPEGGEVRLLMHADDDRIDFSVISGGNETPMGQGLCHYLSSETAGGFTGVLFGMYAIDADNRSAEFTGLRMAHTEE